MEIRPFETAEDYEACMDLQKEVWGPGFKDLVPSSLLMVVQKVGGISAGAFDGQGRLQGFVFGMTGVQDGRLVHWSDMLAVRRGLRGQGLGKRLKLYQREGLLKLGVETVYWTFDPLEAPNAHLNLNGLGAEISEYVVDMYGAETFSDLHRGIGSDRFVAAWSIASERVERTLAGGAQDLASGFFGAPILNPDGEGEDGRRDGARFRIEIPADIQAVKEESPARGMQWRESTRRAFTGALESGYTVRAFLRDGEGRCFYGLARQE